MLSLLRRLTSNKPVVFSIAAILVLGAAAAAATTFPRPQAAEAQQGGPPEYQERIKAYFVKIAKLQAEEGR